MALEIERKFLVNLQELGKLENGIDIKQGYIKTVDNTVVRVRVKGLKAYLTIKGKNFGISRLEFEYEIPLEEANEILEKLCSGSIIEKTRYEIKYENHLWEVDIFYKKNEGLVLAEVELEYEDEDLILPNWVKQEVTTDIRYYNNNLLKSPFSTWK